MWDIAFRVIDGVLLLISGFFLGRTYELKHGQYKVRYEEVYKAWLEAIRTNTLLVANNNAWNNTSQTKTSNASARHTPTISKNI